MADEILASRLVDEEMHGRVTQQLLKEIRWRVANGYEKERFVEKRMLKDLHFLLTFFHQKEEDGR